jgi:hypothetical protein
MELVYWYHIQAWLTDGRQKAKKSGAKIQNAHPPPENKIVSPLQNFSPNGGITQSIHTSKKYLSL